MNVAFWKSVDELKRAHEFPLGPVSSNWISFTLPVSAERILKLGPGAIPALEDLKKSNDRQTSSLAYACISVMEAKKVTRQGTFRSQVGGVEFVTYSVSE